MAKSAGYFENHFYEGAWGAGSAQGEALSLENRSLQMVAFTRLEKQTLKLNSYLELVPIAYREAVISIAKEAYPTMGQGRTLERFIEDMALNWLVKKRMFEALTRLTGFGRVQKVQQNYGGSIVGMSINGSVIMLGKPAADSQRAIYYYRIPIREPVDFEPILTGRVIDKLQRDCSLKTDVLRTSILIGLATNKKAEDKYTHETCITLIKAFDTINGATIYKLRA